MPTHLRQYRRRWVRLVERHFICEEKNHTGHAYIYSYAVPHHHLHHLHPLNLDVPRGNDAHGAWRHRRARGDRAVVEARLDTECAYIAAAAIHLRTSAVAELGLGVGRETFMHELATIDGAAPCRACNPRCAALNVDGVSMGSNGMADHCIFDGLIDSLAIWILITAIVGAHATVLLVICCMIRLVGLTCAHGIRACVRPSRRAWAIAGHTIDGRRFRRKRRRGRIRAKLLGRGTNHIKNIHVLRSGCRGRRRTVLTACCFVFLATCRIGEAAHPGPGAEATAEPQHQPAGHGIGAIIVDASWNTVTKYPAPHRDGFRGAIAPGHEDTDADRVPRNSPGLRLCIEAVNSTGWGPLKRRLTATQAHAVLAQETWIMAHQIPAARRWAKRNGWTSLWAPAVPGKGGGASGGAAIFVRRDMGLRGPDVGSHVIEDAHAVMGIAEFPGHRPVVLVSS